MSVRGGVVSRLLLIEDSPVLVRAWEAGSGRVVFRAESVDPAGVVPERSEPAGRDELELAIERMRFALAVDDDLTPFYRRFRRDPLLGPQLRRRPWLRPRRRPWAWEALAWAVVKQLIETVEAMGEQGIGLQSLHLAVERLEHDMGDLAVRPFQRLELVGHDDVDLAGIGQLFHLARALGRGAELVAAMHDHDIGGDVGERQRPVDG